MLVKELIAELQKFDTESHVVVTWEGTFNILTAANVYITPGGVVIIDADNNDYKDRIVAGEYDGSISIYIERERG